MWHSAHCMCFVAFIPDRFRMREVVLMVNDVFVDVLRV